MSRKSCSISVLTIIPFKITQSSRHEKKRKWCLAHISVQLKSYQFFASFLRTCWLAPHILACLLTLVFWLLDRFRFGLRAYNSLSSFYPNWDGLGREGEKKSAGRKMGRRLKDREKKHHPNEDPAPIRRWLTISLSENCKRADKWAHSKKPHLTKSPDLSRLSE